MTDAEAKAKLEALIDHLLYDSRLYEQLFADRIIYGRCFIETTRDDAGRATVRRVDPAEVFKASSHAPMNTTA